MTPTSAPSISVIVASYQRPRWLERCLTALSQLDYPTFEIVIAADPGGLEAIAQHPAAAHIKTTQAGEPGLSATRNLGLKQASGQLIAFLDDDAVPEPMWLRFHAEALHATQTAASVGYVRGRNGISFQSRVESVDVEAETHREQSPDVAPFVPSPATGRAVKLVGTNFVIRRDILCDLGGFDEGYRFFLDDTDLSLRLLAAGHKAAVAPLAEVHHANAPSNRRTPARRPRDLHDIGRSTAYFLHRHSVASSQMFHRMERRERGRLLRHMVAGTCEPRDIPRLLATLREGWEDGLGLNLAPLDPIRLQAPAFLPFPAKPPCHDVAAARVFDRDVLTRSDRRKSVFRFSRTTLRHHVRFTDEGVWLQTGGQFGASVREGQMFRWCRFADRVEEETSRVAMQRGIGEH